MTDEAQPPRERRDSGPAGSAQPDEPASIDPPADLLRSAERVTGRWVRRVIAHAAARAGSDTSDWDDLDDVVDASTERILDDLRVLLAQDVDEQRVNPLSVYRASVAEPTAYLRRRDVAEPPADRFAAERFPDDPYQLGPATWSDIDPELHEPGLIWGAWKAKVILTRRRDEGQR